MDYSEKNKLKARDLGINTYRENIIFMRADCPVSISEGLKALTRVVVHKNGKSIVATLYIVNSNIISNGEAGLSSEAMTRLGIKDSEHIFISHLHPIASLSKMRAKIFGKELDETAYSEIMKDIASGRYSNIEIAAFVSACAGNNLAVSEMISLTKAMIATGTRIVWNKDIILDKHSVGGLPGNRTTPIVVSILAAAGQTIPKTSSRAITSPAGTADTMETMTNVTLSIEQIKEVVEKEGGCFSWGGAVKLSPADDILIAVEKALEVDSEGQMIASVLSKKVAAGSTHVIIDIPVGPTAKVRSQEEALKLQYYFKAVSETIGIKTDVIMTDGSQPVGRGIGPSLEAIDILQVLRNDENAPPDLKERAIELAAALLKLSGQYENGTEAGLARSILENGLAYKKFIAICQAQGGFREPVTAIYHYDVLSEKDGTVADIDNRKLARIAKLAGAPKVPAAGVYFNAPLGKQVKAGDMLFRIYAESNGELEYAKAYVQSIGEFIKLT